MSSADEQNPMRARLRLVSANEMVSPGRANRARERAVTGTAPSLDADPAMAASHSAHAGRAGELAEVQRRPGLDLPPMPGLSANHMKFLAIMSGEVAGDMSGQAGVDDGSPSARREDDPAFAVGAALFMWRYCRRGLPMPRRVLQLLERHAAAGDPTCILVRDWLRTKMAGSVQRFFRVLEGGRQS